MDYSNNFRFIDITGHVQVWYGTIGSNRAGLGITIQGMDYLNNFRFINMSGSGLSRLGPVIRGKEHLNFKKQKNEANRVGA